MNSLIMTSGRHWERHPAGFNIEDELGGDISVQDLVHVLLCLMYLGSDSLCQFHICARK